MKTNYILFILCFWFLPMQSQYTSVPDPIFEQELLNQQIDSDGLLNQQVLTSDVNSITSLIIQVDFIQDYTGLEAFVSLESLELGGYGSFNTLNLSSLTNLKHFFLSACFVTNLDFSQNVNLESITIFNDYTSIINIDNCLQLNKLIIACPQITTINLSNNSNLKEFSSYRNQITNFNTSQNSLLEKLYISVGFDQLPPTIDIDLTNNVNLKYLFIKDAIIPSINLDNNTLLDYLLLYNTSLSSINLSNNSLLKYLNVNLNQLATLEISNLPLLEFLACQYNTISTLNVNNNTNLGLLNCGNNNMQSLFVQNGSNQLLNGTTIIDTFTIPRFYANNNTNLTCIFVDDIANVTQNWVSKDPNSTYVLSQQECNNLNVEIFERNSLKIYPNPTSDFINISLSNESLENSKIEIYNLLGALIYSKDSTTENPKINVQNFSKGIYILSVEKNGTILKSKFIVQ